MKTDANEINMGGCFAIHGVTTLKLFRTDKFHKILPDVSVECYGIKTDYHFVIAALADI